MLDAYSSDLRNRINWIIIIFEQHSAPLTNDFEIRKCIATSHRFLGRVLSIVQFAAYIDTNQVDINRLKAIQIKFQDKLISLAMNDKSCFRLTKKKKIGKSERIELNWLLLVGRK